MASDSIQKIDMNSPEFLSELQKTKQFTDKVIQQFGFFYNPDSEVNESIQLGLTRHKMLHGKRYCPCFFVTHTKEDRLCPCKPALAHEIPHEGHCHCGIYCSKEFIEASLSSKA